jgi:hypothetical protein
VISVLHRKALAGQAIKAAMQGSQIIDRLPPDQREFRLAYITQRHRLPLDYYMPWL